MKVIVAHCSGRNSSDMEALADRLQHFLLESGLEVESLELPPVDQSNPLRTLAAWRLIPLSGMANGLLCLDAWTAVLRHPAKVVWLHADEAFNSKGEEPSYLDNILIAGIRECATMFATSVIHDRLKAEGWKHLRRLDPEQVRSPASGRSSKSGAGALLKALRS